MDALDIYRGRNIANNFNCDDPRASPLITRVVPDRTAPQEARNGV